MNLSDKRMNNPCDIKDGYYPEEKVKESIRKLKERGLKKTLCPKYLMLTIDDLIELLGKELLE